MNENNMFHFSAAYLPSCSHTHTHTSTERIPKKYWSCYWTPPSHVP